MGYGTRTLLLPVYIREGGGKRGERGWGRELSAPQTEVVSLPSSAVQPSFSFNCRKINKRTGDSLDLELKNTKQNKKIHSGSQSGLYSRSHEKSHTLQKKKKHVRK